jgi:hypothetical protein
MNMENFSLWEIKFRFWKNMEASASSDSESLIFWRLDKLWRNNGNKILSDLFFKENYFTVSKAEFREVPL